MRPAEHFTALCAWSKQMSGWSVKNSTFSVPALQGCEGLWPYDYGNAMNRNVFARPNVDYLNAETAVSGRNSVSHRGPGPTRKKEEVNLVVERRRREMPRCALVAKQ